jgi:LmbE family N-acetylglucosaminyl deacetylase
MFQQELGTTLGIWAHPDDEAYLSGGLMALASDAGARVVCVTATRGERGTPDPLEWPPERLAVTRTAELARCLEILGVTEHRWMGYRDGECAAADEAEAVAQLCEVIEEVRPDTVLSFGPDGVTGHPDHRAVSAWATTAFAKAAPPGARLLHSAVPELWEKRWSALHARFSVYLPGYPVTVPEAALAVNLTLDAAQAERKVRALMAQETQTGPIVAAMGIDTYTAWVSGEAFVAWAFR